MKKLPKQVKSMSKYDRWLGAYKYPPERAPVLPVQKSRKGGKRLEVLKHKVCTYDARHKVTSCSEGICSTLSNGSIEFHKQIEEFGQDSFSISIPKSSIYENLM